MDEHDEVADGMEREMASLEHDSERLGEHSDEARDKLDRANSDGLIPEALGPRDPSWSEPQATDDTSADANIGSEH